VTQKVLCIGTLIVDIINEAIDRMLHAGEAVNTTVEVQLGGNAYNVAVDLIKLGLREGQVGCVGALGNDHFGELFERELQNYGAISLVCQIPEKRTSKNIILQVKGQARRYHYDEGANIYLDFDFVVDKIKTFQPDLLYIGEIAALGEIGKNLKQVLAVAKELDCLTVADAIIMPDEDWRCFHEAAHLIDVLHCNDYEAKAITGQTEVPAVIECLLELGIVWPIVTRGDKELVCAYQGYYYSVPSFKVVSVDSTGAGDAFTAGLIKKLLEFAGSGIEDKLGPDSNFLEAICFGKAAGASCVTALGCTPAVNEKNVRQLLDSQSKEVLSNIIQNRL
jgi:sugar/nucleoside kinase (ribokinase family)